jgi:hypothetical protein
MSDKANRATFLKQFDEAVEGRFTQAELVTA